MGMPAANPGRRGFSLIELVLVVAIIGVVAAIAIPRLSRGSQGAAEAALVRDVAMLQQALEYYVTEHNGVYPAPDEIKRQLTKYTDINGNISENRTATHIYGPYLRSIPPLPVGPRRGSTQLALPCEIPLTGWVYVPALGIILPNIATTDVSARTLTDLGLSDDALAFLPNGS